MDSIERSIAHYKTVQELVEWRTRAEQAEARVAALEAALAEMGNAMEAGAYDAAWKIRNAALARTTPAPEGKK